LIFEFRRQGQVEFATDGFHHRGVAAAKEMSRHIGQVDADAKLCQLINQHLRRDDFAVDQHAVAIEDHQIKHQNSAANLAVSMPGTIWPFGLTVAVASPATMALTTASSTDCTAAI